MSTESAIDIADNLRVGYEQLCQSYHAIDDFRAKLLGFLPVVTGGGLVLLTKKDEDLFLMVGLFGLVMTSGLFAYEIYGIRKCHALLITGVALEIALNLQCEVRPKHEPRVVDVGQFQNRPRTVLPTIQQRGPFRWVPAVNEPFAAAIIYPGVMSAWFYLAMYHTPFRLVGGGFAIVIFFLGLVGTITYNHRLGKDAGNQIKWIFDSLVEREKAAVDEVSMKPRSDDAASLSAPTP
jgi:hypothetical protein